MVNNKADLYLIEDFAPGVVGSGERIVAISPEAAYDLDQRSVAYSITEDYYSLKKLLEGEEAYFAEQLEWFSRFDSLFRDKVPYCSQEDIDLATAHYYRVKCLVDSLVIYSRVLAEVFGKTGTKEVLYLRKKEDNIPPSVYAPFAAQKTVICRLASCIAAQKGIRFSVHEDISVKEERATESFFDIDGIKDMLKKFYVREVMRAVKYRKWKQGVSRMKSVNILALHAGGLAHDDLIKNVIGSGGKVFLKEGRSLLLVNDLLEREVLDMGSLMQGNEAVRVRQALGDVLEEFMKDRALAGWIDDKCGVDVSSIIRPYFEDLILNVMFENLMDLPVLKEFYHREDIDFIVSRSSSEKESISSLIAAAKGKKRVCMQHACGAYENKHDQITDLAFFDHYFAMHGDAEEQAKSICGSSSYVGNCNVYQAPYQMLNVFNENRRSKRDASLVLYIPSKLFLGFRCFNGSRYPVTWYYKFQKELIDLFGSRKDLNFIFKQAAGQVWAENSILPYIKGKTPENIYVETRPLSECLDKAGRALTDYPSTSFYEAGAAGIPVMSLYPDTLKIMPQSEKLFGRSLREFKDIRGAISAVDEFLSADPSAYMVDIPMRETDVVEVLREIKTGRMSMASENLV